MHFLITAVGTRRCLSVLGSAAVWLLHMPFAHGQDWQHAYDLSGNLVVRAAASATAPPRILGQPQLQIVSPGEVGTFSVVVAEARGLTYQWRFNGIPLSGSGATSDSLLLGNVSTANEGSYSVVVANNSGSVTSAPAMLMLDNDEDGLPDSWELTYFGNLTSQRSGGDRDADGISNVDEFRDGTNPTNRAIFRPRLTVATIGSGFGEVTVDPLKLSYERGEMVTVSAVPLGPSLFVGWTGSLNTTNNSATLSMDSNTAIQAKFVTAVPPPPGMIALWRAETDASDTSGTHHGAFYSGANEVGPSVTASGKVGSAFSFDGTVHVRVPDSAALKPARMTAEAWVYPTLQTNQYQTILARGSSTSSSVTWHLGTFNGVPHFTSHLHHDLAAPFKIPLNQWTHLAISFDGSTKRLYVNGAQAASQGDLGAWAYDAAAIPLTIGSDWDFNLSSFRFNGRIDEVALYNRALTASEIAGTHDADAAGRVLDAQYFTSPAQLPHGYVGAAYHQQVSVILGMAPITLAVVDGVLPPGVTLSPTGVLGGAPSAAGLFHFTVRSTDAAAVSTEQLATLAVIDRVIPPAGMVGWWQGENDALDSAGANHGTFSNGVTFADGQVGQTFAFNGESQSVSIPDAPALRSGSITLEAWVRFNTKDTFQVIFSKPLGSGTIESYMLYLAAPGTLNGRVGDISGFGGNISGGMLTTGRWYHVAYTFDGVIKQQILYLDGVQVASGTGSKSIGYDTQPVLLGRDSENGSPNYFLNGSLDEAAIYNRVLSAAEIDSIYLAGPAGKSTDGPYLNAPSQLPDAFARQSYAYLFTSPRGTAPISFALVEGSLPAGLTLNSDGLVQGVPTAAGTFDFILRVTDGAALSVDQAFTLQAIEQVSAPDGLVAWWRGEVDAMDAVGANHGILTNGVTYAPGKVGQAFSLNGPGQAVVIPDAPALRLTSLTFEAWVSFDSLSGLQFIFAKPLGAGANNSYALWWVAGGFYGSVADAAGQNLSLFAPSNPTLGRWYHVAYVFDDVFDVHAIYIDGALAASAVVTKSIAYDTQPALLGRDTEGGLPNYSFQGRIDEAAVYNRALSGAEIGSIYSAGPLGKSPALWPPLLLEVSRQGEFISISFAASLGRPYTVEYANALDAEAWSVLTNGTAAETNVVSFDSLTNLPQRFYRVFTPGN